MDCKIVPDVPDATRPLEILIRKHDQQPFVSLVDVIAYLREREKGHLKRDERNRAAAVREAMVGLEDLL